VQCIALAQVQLMIDVVPRWMAWRIAYLASLFLPAVAIAIGITIWGRTSLQFIIRDCDMNNRQHWTNIQLSALRLLHINRGLQLVMLYQMLLLLLYTFGPRVHTSSTFFAVNACASFGIFMLPFATGIAVPHPVRSQSSIAASGGVRCCWYSR
jgi:hypothetical protein